MISNKVGPAEKSLPPRQSGDSAPLDNRVGGGKNASKKNALYNNKSDLDDLDVEKVGEHAKGTQKTLDQHGHALRTILPQIINEQNRKTFGTWQRQLDFTRTIIGYLLGIHNFFRFPYLCYKFGGVFFIPYVLMMIIVGIPIVFMEFTIGQYYGVGSYVAFTHMSPILSGVSKLLTWSCVVNCWMYTVILAWLRIYSNDATSCLKGWEVCEDLHYYNTPHCFTGSLDDECNDPGYTSPKGLTIQQVMQNDMLYYNFRCRTVDYYCKAHGWTLSPGERACVDGLGKRRSIYERRIHAIDEYFYGAVLGLQRRSELIRDDVLLQVILAIAGLANETDIINEIYPPGTDIEKIKKEKKRALYNPTETMQRYLTFLKNSPDPLDQQRHAQITDIHFTKAYQDRYWDSKAQLLTEDTASSSYKEMQRLSLTTWIMIAVFLFEDLLKISFLSYILNAVPFVILIFVTVITVNFDYSGHGIEQIFATKEGFFADLSHLDIWCEAVIQVIYTTGVGNGVLISLATFNNINHNYTVDLYVTLSLAIITSCCGVLITFCSLGHYLTHYRIDIPFREYIKPQSTSSVEFCMIVYSIFLTLISDQNVTIFLFFFMLTSFATDTAIRLVQSVLDTVMEISARFKHHSVMVLVSVCSMGYLILAPMMKNGAFVLFVDFEYFTLNYMMPTIVLIEVGACVVIYKASRIIDHSEQMGVSSSYSFRLYMITCMYLAFFAILSTVFLKLIHHKSVRFNGVEAEAFTETFGWVFITSPLIMVTLSVVKQLIVVPRGRWGWLLMPLRGKDRKVRRAFLRRIQGQGDRLKGDGYMQTTDQEDIRDAALKWRKLESKLILAMMAKRREEKEKSEKGTTVENTANTTDVGVGHEKTPLLVSLVKIAAAAKKEDDEYFGGHLPQDKEEDNNGGVTVVKIEDDDFVTNKKESPEIKSIKDDESVTPVARAASRSRRLAFIHVKKATFFGRIVAAFLGKASSTGKSHRPKRHVGGGVKTRIVTRHSADGSKIVNLEEDDDQQLSEESLVSNDEEEVDDKLREKYLNGLDYLERWPGRLDESELESEGSSVHESEEEVDDVF